MKHTKILLRPLQKRLLYGTTFLLWGTGAVWLYLLEADPSRPLWMKLHGAAAMVFLILFGTLLMQHVPAGWQQNRQRPSGISMIAMCAILILTGWGLYYIGNDSLRHWTSQIHIVLGLGFPLLLFLHILFGRRS